jgi:hypothetical protein
MMKRTRIGENKVIEFRSEFFNIFNHANFGNPEWQHWFSQLWPHHYHQRPKADSVCTEVPLLN